MVSDQEIATGVETLLRSSNPNSVTSIDGFIKQLEAKLGFDLSHKEHFIRSQIDFLLRSQVRLPPQPQPHQHQHLPQFQNPEIPPYFAIPLNNYQSPPPPPPNPQPQQQQQQQKPQRKKPKKAPVVLIPNVAVDSADLETPKESTPTGTKRKGGTGGLNKVCGVSPELQAIVGEPTMPRTQIVKQLWAYIRQNNLQDPSNKRKIICNDALRLVFETDSTDMFKMNKLLSKHITSLEPSKEPRQPSKKLKAEVESTSETTEAAGPSLVIISDTLAKFFGSGGREMSQTEAVRRVWEYIKVNHLEVMVGNRILIFFAAPLTAAYVLQKRGEDPRNSMVIVCDPKLQELFGCESISALRLSDMLVPHFFMPS